MATSISQIGMRLVNYPGIIHPADPSIYIYPEIHYYTKTGTKKAWIIYVMFCRGDQIQAQLNEDGARNQAKIVKTPIDASYYDKNPPFPVYARIVTATREKSLSIKPATLVTVGKNLAHVNETTIFHQALIESFSKYCKFALDNRHFDKDSPHLKSRVDNQLLQKLHALSGYVSPMLPCVADVNEWWNKHGAANIYGQLKLNGTRCIASLFGSIDNSLRIYTRNARLYPINNFWSEMTTLTTAYPDIIFDGEAYKHGETLQAISGSMRNQGKTAKVGINLDFYVYDIYVPTNTHLTFAQRYEQYMSISRREFVQAFKFIKFLPATKFGSYEEMRAHFDSAIAEGYEGLVLKDMRGIYEPSRNGYRSEMSVKVKNVVSSEFQLIGIREGTGKAMGMISSFVCRITKLSVDNLHGQKLSAPLAVGQEFACNIKADEATKKEWFNDESFMRDNRGRYVTVEFRDVSRDGIPLQSYWIDFADVDEPAEITQNETEDFN